MLKRSDSDLLYVGAGDAEGHAAELAKGHAFDVLPILVLDGWGKMLAHLQIPNHIKSNWHAASANDLTDALHKAISFNIHECLASDATEPQLPQAPMTPMEVARRMQQQPRQVHERFEIAEGTESDGSSTAIWNVVQTCGPSDASRTTIVRKTLLSHCGAVATKAFLAQFTSTVLSGPDGYRRVFVDKDSRSKALGVRSRA